MIRCPCPRQWRRESVETLCIAYTRRRGGRQVHRAKVTAGGGGVIRNVHSSAGWIVRGWKVGRGVFAGIHSGSGRVVRVRKVGQGVFTGVHSGGGWVVHVCKVGRGVVFGNRCGGGWTIHVCRVGCDHGKKRRGTL